MDMGTGELIKTVSEMERGKMYVRVNRDLTHKEKCDQKIQLYSPCGCGSGKKFKFCCRTK